MASEEFNSSDIEVEIKSNRFANLGKDSISSMLDSALEDRIQSKRVAKALDDVHGSLSSQRYRALWLHRLQAFRENTLGASLDMPPTGQDIERFLTSIIGHIKPKTSAGVPSITTIRGGLKQLIMALIFHYPTFSLSKHERRRIHTTVEHHRQAGRLTTDPQSARLWLKSATLQHLLSASFAHVLSLGCHNWDVFLSKALSIVLCAAMACRPGDFMAAPNSSKSQYLAWKDVSLTLTGTDLESFIASITLRFEKMKKADNANNRIIQLKPLDAINNVLCPIRLLLIVALRSGAVAERSISALIESVAKSKRKKITWTYPSRAVIPALETSGSRILTDKAALAKQLHKSLSEFSLWAGLVEPYKPSDIRRGAASDGSEAILSNKFTATYPVAAMLGHSRKSYVSGITDHYVGASNQDLWTPRVEVTASNKSTQPVVVQPYRKVKRTYEEISEMVRQEGQDPKNQKYRNKVTRADNKRRITEWRQDSTPVDTPNVDVDQDPDFAIDPIGRTLDTSMIDPIGPNLDTSMIDHGDQDPDFAIDPRLRSMVGSIAGLFTNEDPVQGTDHDLVAEIDPNAYLFLQTDLDVNLTQTTFVDVFAKINLTTSNDSTFFDTLRPLQANFSQTPLSRFMYPCRNQNRGCPFSSPTQGAAHDHAESRACYYATESTLQERPVACPHPSCHFRFKNSTRQRAHEKMYHSDWVPRPCTGGTPGCDGSLFNTLKEWKKHGDTYHNNYSFVAMKCPVKDCEFTKTYETKKSLSGHLRHVHHLKDRALALAIADGKYEVPRKQRQGPCAVPGCSYSSKLGFSLKPHMSGGVHASLTQEQRDAYTYVQD